jgi:hypothetical protein
VAAVEDVEGVEDVADAAAAVADPLQRSPHGAPLRAPCRT